MDTNKRKKTESHHSATHLVHAALKHVLGDHVQQKGSLVDEYKLRFDFSHKTALTEEEIRRIEEMVNAEILKNVEVTTKIMDLDDAKKTGAESLFGEKYDEQVRVLSIGEDDFSLGLRGYSCQKNWRFRSIYHRESIECFFWSKNRKLVGKAKSI